jgi:hypothetical protein
MALSDDDPTETARRRLVGAERAKVRPFEELLLDNDPLVAWAQSESSRVAGLTRGARGGSRALRT